ncbi:MAG: transcriptional regulator, partial [Hyphomicrobiales bacterium]
MQLQFGDYKVLMHERALVGPDGPIELGSRSFDLLTVLLRQPNQLLDKAALFDAVWPGVVVEENTLQVHMSALRKALGPGFVTTVHGRGYKYVGPAPRQAEEPTLPLRGGAAGNIGSYRADCVARETEIETVRR